MKRTHPMQGIVWATDRVIRFRRNAIVERLLETSSLDLNDIARMDFSEADRMQLAQLIGYSVSGFGDLSYASRDVVRRADKKAAALALKEPKP